MFIDYYKILEVSFHANKVDITKSYRRLTKKYHPDLNGGNRQYEEKLALVIKAFKILTDDELKSSYDKEWLEKAAQFKKNTPDSKSSSSSLSGIFSTENFISNLKDHEVIIYLSCFMIIVAIIVYEIFWM